MMSQLEQRSRLALACYEQAAAIMAQRAGAGFAADPGPYAKVLADAQHLALPQPAPMPADLPVLTSLLGHLYGHDGHGYYAPRPLGHDAATVMPTRTRPADLSADYAALWQQFAAARSQLLAVTGGKPVAQEVGYHALLQRFAWSMPAPGSGDGDVPLFDFARTSAALAVCLDGRSQADAADDAVALLIGGDVSGVQDWLYTIGSSGAAKSLRGRSVYLQLLSEIIALYVLDTLQLPACNLLYVGGGNFYLLAPAAAAASLPALQREITGRLLRIHDGALYLAVGHTLITRSDLLAQATGAIWGRVNLAVGARKRQRFTELDDTAMAQALGAALAGTGKLEDTCAICRRPIVPGEDAQLVDEEDENNKARTCALCTSFADLGALLPRARFLVISKLPPEHEYSGRHISQWLEGMVAFGYNVQFVTEHGDEQEWHVVPGSELVRVCYWRADDLPAVPRSLQGGAAVQVLRPLAQAAPVRDGTHGQIATFEQLRAEGIQRWGVLRMDVDNLGRIFQEGLAASSLSRVVSLSAQLRLLFEGYIPRLMKEYNRDHPQSTYLMYAGGDDLFVVGGWSHLPELAAKVRAALVEFAVANPKVTISGGISLALDDNYPIYQAAQAAGRAEDMAKDAGKDRLAFLGQAIFWDGNDATAYPRVRVRVQQLHAWLGNGGKLNRSFLMRLRAIDAEWRAWQASERRAPRYGHANQRFFLGPWQWHLVYGLSREAERRGDEELRNEIRQLVDAIVTGEIEVLGLEARWAELLTRAPKDDRDLES